ncbi:MAG: twin-arginine translocase TatA/TatE family subunit [Acidimicrobiales bacterium]
MGNLGGGEILVIMLVALLVLGPAKLPDAARQLGKAVAEFRKVSGGFQRELRAALEVEPEPTPAAQVPSGLPAKDEVESRPNIEVQPEARAVSDEAPPEVKVDTPPADHTDPTP